MEEPFQNRHDSDTLGDLAPSALPRCLPALLLLLSTTICHGKHLVRAVVGNRNSDLNAIQIAGVGVGAAAVLETKPYGLGFGIATLELFLR